MKKSILTLLLLLMAMASFAQQRLGGLSTLRR